MLVYIVKPSYLQATDTQECMYTLGIKIQLKLRTTKHIH